MKFFFKPVIIFSFAIIAFACSQSKAPTGKATLSGKFSGSFPFEKTFTVKVSVPNLVDWTSLKQSNEYETKVDMDGSFSLSIPLFRSVYAMFSVNDENLGAFFLSPDKETKIKLSFSDSNKIQANVIKGQELTMGDIEKINKPFFDFTHKVFYEPNSFLNDLRWNMSPEEYRNYILQWTDKQISTAVDENKDLPENLNQLMHRELKWVTFTSYLFDYENTVRKLYKNKRNENETNDTAFIPVKPNKTYYSFLSYFDWNNSPVYNTPSYQGMFQHILADSILNIPNIGNQPLTDWLKQIKMTMSPLVGSDAGMFYDMLTLHAYMKQLDDDSKPLSKQQIEDIKAYFKNPTFAKYLFEKNEVLIKQTKFPFIKETPSANKGNLMDAIVSSYKGKAVVVDFWATWCGPCMEALKEIKPVKEEFLNKNVVFVYITDTSSPKELWEKTIQNISGEQYYLTNDESVSISTSKQYSFDAIPSYFLFDSNGVLKNKFTGYPGTEAMRAMIEKLLPKNVEKK